MSNFIHFLNNKFITEEELVISPRDLGLTRGYAVADFLVTHNHKPFKLEEHVDRLFKSAEIIGLKFPWSKAQIIDWVNQTLDKNDKASDKTIKIIITGGISHSMYQENSPTIAIIIDDYVPPPHSYYKNGVKAIAVNFKRPYSASKHTDYIEAIKELSKVKDRNISEVIYYDDYQVFEGAGSNLFAVINNKLVTPKSNIVEGITRNVLLKILKLKIYIEVRNFTFKELLKASEIFLTGSAKEIRGIVELNGKPVGKGTIGKITKEVANQYHDYVLKEAGKRF